LCQGLVLLVLLEFAPSVLEGGLVLYSPSRGEGLFPETGLPA
jgi:hypothetical protein